MKKTTKDKEIEKLKKQVEKLKSEKESLKRDKRSLGLEESGIRMVLSPSLFYYDLFFAKIKK